MATYGYARLATDGQTLDAQGEALKAAGCDVVIRETASGSRDNLTELMSAIGAGDVLLVLRLDRLARSRRELVAIVEAISSRGGAIRSLSEPWADMTSGRGPLLLSVLRGFAEFGRASIGARAADGRSRAGARGRRMGRPPRLTPDQQAEARRALANGDASQADLARRFAVSQSTISRLGETAPAPRPREARTLDAETERAARAFMKRLEGRHPAIEGLVFGSRARGDHRPDSDADLAVVLAGEPGDRYKVSSDMAGLAFDVMLETGVLVQAVPLWVGEFESPGRFGNPRLIEAIRREGIPV